MYANHHTVLARFVHDISNLFFLLRSFFSLLLVFLLARNDQSVLTIDSQVFDTCPLAFHVFRFIFDYPHYTKSSNFSHQIIIEVNCFRQGFKLKSSFELINSIDDLSQQILKKINIKSESQRESDHNYPELWMSRCENMFGRLEIKI